MRKLINTMIVISNKDHFFDVNLNYVSLHTSI